jgi:hypothetical protein
MRLPRNASPHHVWVNNFKVRVRIPNQGRVIVFIFSALLICINGIWDKEWEDMNSDR